VTSLIADAWTVLYKELRELVFVRSREPVRALVIVSIMILLGVLLPVLAGPFWLDRLWLLALWAWAPVFLVASVVADLVAGEREGHTLETLLASRLPGRAILLGKVGAAVLYGWGLMLLTVLLSIAVINSVYSGDSLLLYRPLMAVGGGLLSLLAALLAASVGVLISLRSASVRQAQRRVLGGLLGLFLVQALVLSLYLGLFPSAWGQAAAALLDAFDHVAVVALLALLLTAVNVALLYAAVGAFRRHAMHMD